MDQLYGTPSFPMTWDKALELLDKHLSNFEKKEILDYDYIYFYPGKFLICSQQ